MTNETEIYYLANFYYGKLDIVIGDAGLYKIPSEQDGWEIVDKAEFFRLKAMYDAGKRDVIRKVSKSLEG
jgi:hypothetical protein